MEEIKPLHEEGRDVLVPNQDQSSHKEGNGTKKKCFVYNKEKDTYTCPEGQQLILSRTDTIIPAIEYFSFYAA